MIAALSLLSGVLLGLLSAGVPGWAWRVAAVSLLGAWLLSSWRHRRWSIACAALLAGQLLAQSHAGHWLERRLPEPGSDTRVIVEGRIDDIPARAGQALRFHLRTDSLQGLSVPDVSRRLRVEWRDARTAPRVGERWRLLLRLAPLEETRNFSGLDRARLAFRDGVHGGGRVLPSAMNELLELAPARLHTLRARIAERARDSIADPDAAALVVALSVGLTDGLTRDQWRVFNATGTTHLVAISGLHVTLFAWLMFRGARFAWRRLPTLPLSREAFALWLGLAAAGGYALLAGLSVPTQRTWLMLALYVGARLAARRVDGGRFWSLALMLVLLSDARAPLAAGFWLSFIAVGVLIAFVGRWSALRVQLAIMLALLPAGLAIFGGVSLVGLAVNLVAIPLISLLLVPVVLAGALLAWMAPSLDGPVFALAAWMYQAFWPGLAWCADLDPTLVFWRAAPPAGWFVCAIPAALVWLCAWPRALRLTAACALLPLIWPPPRPPAMDTARVAILDAGRGSAVLIRTHRHALLFDTGDSWRTRGRRLVDIVLPALDATRTEAVDLLLLPALDDDRARAAALLAGERGVGAVRIAGGWPGNGLATRCRDARWTWDGVAFASHSIGRYCLLRVSVGQASLLLPGDLDAAGERALLASVPRAALASDVALVGRQASALASSSRWIESIAPGLAVATGGVDGARARRVVLERWRAQGSRVLDTRHDGAIELEIAASGVTLRGTARAARFPFHWRRPV